MADIDDLEAAVAGADDLNDLEALVDSGDLDIEAAPPMEDIQVPQSMGEIIPPSEAVLNLGDTDAGAELVSMWGGSAAAEEQVQIAQREGVGIINDLERHNPGAATVLINAVNNMTPSETAAVFAALAKRGKK